jgi:hypothetical protein
MEMHLPFKFYYSALVKVYQPFVRFYISNGQLFRLFLWVAGGGRERLDHG